MTLDQKINSNISNEPNCLGWFNGYTIFKNKFSKKAIRKSLDKEGFIFTNSGKLIHLKVKNPKGNHLQAYNAPSYREWDWC